MAEEEKNRLEEQRSQLGENGLAEKAKQLEDATEFNAVNIIAIKFSFILLKKPAVIAY
jgi:hypothetical protein